MSIESKRIDLILDEFDKPAIVEPQARTHIISQKRPKSELVNDYVDLYKNFNEFNARYNPRRAEEIKVVFLKRGNRSLPCAPTTEACRVCSDR